MGKYKLKSPVILTIINDILVDSFTDGERGVLYEVNKSLSAVRIRAGFCKITKEYKNRRKCIIRPVSDGINECQPACEN